MDPEAPLDDTPHSQSALRALQEEWMKPRDAVTDIKIAKKQQ